MMDRLDVIGQLDNFGQGGKWHVKYAKSRIIRVRGIGKVRFFSAFKITERCDLIFARGKSPRFILSY